MLKLQAAMPGEPETDHPRPERLIAGNPRRDTWNRVDADLGGSRLHCGVWRCEPGHWRIAMDEGEHELKNRGRLGSGPKDVQKIDTLGRIIELTVNGVAWQGDPRHQKLMEEYFGMDENTKV